MKVRVGANTLELARGDITREETGAIANAANSRLVGGGGVDGAIHRAGGPDLMRELKEKYSGCPTGSAVITGAGKMKAKYVLHAVGPRYRGTPEDCRLLAAAYRSCLDLCVEYGIDSVAFPSISTGIYGYPLDEAAPIAIATIVKHLKSNDSPKLIRFVLFDAATMIAYEVALESLNSKR